jgi:hypothetical protein
MIVTTCGSKVKRLRYAAIVGAHAEWYRLFWE